MREMQRDRSLQVLKLLAESVRQFRKPAHAHSHRQILALNQTCRNVLLIRCSGDHVRVESVLHPITDICRVGQRDRAYTRLVR